MNVVVKKISELKEAKKNIRRHTDKQITEYIRSIDMFGQIKPIVIDADGEIIAGNGLYQALLKMGKETCDCYVMENITPAQKKKLMLADNRVYELGITDVSIFEEIVLELDGDINIPGWDEDLLSMMNASMPDVDEMVSSYGNFEEHDVDRISERKPLQVNNAPLQDGIEESAGYEPVKTITESTQGETQRYIICPRCGERISI